MLTKEDILKHGPRYTEEVIKQNHTLQRNIVPEEITLNTFAAKNRELIASIPEILRTYWSGGRTQEKDEMYVHLVDTLMGDDRFKILLQQYEPLMAINSDHIEEYESDAIKKYYEIYYKKVPQI